MSEDPEVQTSALDPAAALVDASGRPARPAAPRGCPRCGAPPRELVSMSAYRPRGPKLCQQCGYETAGEQG